MKNKQMNKWTNGQRNFESKEIARAKQWIKVIYATPVFKVLLHQLVNEQTNKQMNKCTNEWMFVRHRFCKSRINVLKVLLQICTVAFSFPQQSEMMCVFTKQQSHTLWKVFRGNSVDWKALTWQNVFDICSRDRLSDYCNVPITLWDPTTLRDKKLFKMHSG